MGEGSVDGCTVCHRWGVHGPDRLVDRRPTDGFSYNSLWNAVAREPLRPQSRNDRIQWIGDVPKVSYRDHGDTGLAVGRLPEVRRDDLSHGRGQFLWL